MYRVFDYNSVLFHKEAIKTEVTQSLTMPRTKGRSRSRSRSKSRPRTFERQPSNHSLSTPAAAPPAEPEKKPSISQLRDPEEPEAMITAALAADRRRKGSSFKFIKYYVSKHYRVDDKMIQTMKRTLKREAAKEGGRFVQSSGDSLRGRFKINKDYKSKKQQILEKQSRKQKQSMKQQEQKQREKDKIRKNKERQKEKIQKEKQKKKEMQLKKKEKMRQKKEKQQEQIKKKLQRERERRQKQREREQKEKEKVKAKKQRERERERRERAKWTRHTASNGEPRKSSLKDRSRKSASSVKKVELCQPEQSLLKRSSQTSVRSQKQL